MPVIPEAYRDLIGPESRAIAYLATSMPDGAPIISPVWFGVDAEGYLLFVTHQDSTKGRNMAARPAVAVVLQDPADPYRYLQLRGKLIDRLDDAAAARALLDAFSRRYIGKDYPYETEDESIFKVRIERANGFYKTH